MQERILEEPARDSGKLGAPDGTLVLLEGMVHISAWTALLGDGGRLLRARNREDSAERKLCVFCPLLDVVGRKIARSVQTKLTISDISTPTQLFMQLYRQATLTKVTPPWFATTAVIIRPRIVVDVNAEERKRVVSTEAQEVSESIGLYFATMLHAAKRMPNSGNSLILNQRAEASCN